MKADPAVISNWHTLLEGFSASTQDFYRSLEAAIDRRHLPDIEVMRVLHREGGIVAPRREYLRVKQGRIAFDVCSAPYGAGHFFSWWLAKIPPRLELVATAIKGGVVFGLWLLLMYGFAKVGGSGGCGLAIFLAVVSGAALLYGMGVLVHRGELGDEDWVLSVPYLAGLYTFFFNPTAYYRLDTAMMFRDSVRAAVGEVINELRKGQGLRELSPEELRPIDFFRR